MSVDSKLFVTCGKDKLYDVVNAVTEHLNVFVRTELDKRVEEVGAVNRIDFLWNNKDEADKWTNGVIMSMYDMGCINVRFGIGDWLTRNLSVMPDCSSSYSDTYEGEKIIFSIGCWGKYDQVVKVVAKAVAQFGDVYYDHNDCDDEGFVKLN